ncbi:hypothetical protein N7507_001132 [Penicillium longicatenatum]|nr:hypothetical protein N7507_001132 [Penicillium longicatenatum]
MRGDTKKAEADAGDERDLVIALSHTHGNAAGARSPPIIVYSFNVLVPDGIHIIFTLLQDPVLIQEPLDTIYQKLAFL